MIESDGTTLEENNPKETNNEAETSDSNYLNSKEVPPIQTETNIPALIDDSEESDPEPMKKNKKKKKKKPTIKKTWTLYKTVVCGDVNKILCE